MRVKQKTVIVCLLILLVLTVLTGYLRNTNIPVLEPRGTIAAQEKHLIVISTLLMLIVVVPVFYLTFFVVWKYREGAKHGKKRHYAPNQDGNRLIEWIWWLVPSALIAVLSVIAWNSSHQLDPYRPLASKTPALNIEVVAMDWKWLFIYPKQNVASVNQLMLPLNTPINFQITSDAPMNSFWIPQLSGQIYAMPGMDTQLHLMATKAGTYHGWSANISGRGFAGMMFSAKVGGPPSFADWLKTAKSSPQALNLSSYGQLAQPSTYNKVAYYSSVEHNLYNGIVMKYMMPGGMQMDLDGMVM